MTGRCNASFLILGQKTGFEAKVFPTLSESLFAVNAGASRLGPVECATL